VALGALITAAQEMKEGTFTFVDQAAPSAGIAACMLPKKTQAGTA
jgi:hypothetical protein